MSTVSRPVATLDDLYRTEGKAELIGGRIVHLMPTGFRPGRIGGRIYRSLDDHAAATGQGVALPDNVGFVVPELDSGRRSFSPDAAYFLGPPRRPRLADGGGSDLRLISAAGGPMSSRPLGSAAMPMSTDVSLSKSAVPVFPDRCIACNAPRPDSRIGVGTNAIGWWTLVFWHPGRRFSVQVPACDDCRRRMVSRRWVRRVFEWTLMGVGVAAAFSILGSYRGPFKRWLGLGVALACMAPWFLWQTLFPPPIDLTAYSDTVQYEFRDRDYAEEFLALNR